jgi:tetratricopeptide (TPR) repeat protein
LAKRKRITRKDLKKPDKFISVSIRVLNFISHHKKTATISGIMLVLFMGVIFGWLFYTKYLEAKAQFFLYQACNEYYQKEIEEENNNRFNPGKKSNIDIALNKFRMIIDEYPCSQAANFAFLYLGNCYYKLGDYDHSIIHYNKLLKRKFKVNYLTPFVLDSLGYSYQANRDYEKAINYFNKTIKKSENSLLVQESYLNLGRCYEKLNKKKEAVGIYQELVAKYPDSFYKDLVEWKISKLE